MAAEPFWLSDVGIKLRLEMLSQLVIINTYNNTLKHMGPKIGIDLYRYLTMRDNNVCGECEPYDGRTYRAGQFMPYLPRHPWCRCVYDIGVEMNAG